MNRLCASSSVLPEELFWRLRRPVLRLPRRRGGCRDGVTVLGLVIKANF